MLTTYPDTEITVPYEEEVNVFTVYVEDNPDRWRGGYSWTVCKDGVEFDSGLEFDVADALKQAELFMCSVK